MVAAEKPKLGLYVTVAAGMTNIILDAAVRRTVNGGWSEPPRRQ